MRIHKRWRYAASISIFARERALLRVRHYATDVLRVSHHICYAYADTLLDELPQCD